MTAQTSRPRIGVLALQGDFREHLAHLDSCGAETRRVRRPADLEELDGLVFPGGESTAMSNLIRLHELEEPLRAAIDGGLPVFGSCAGMILLAGVVLDTRPDAINFSALDITVRRNAFGRQVDSFEEDLPFDGGAPIRAVFIRAPWVEAVSPDAEVLAAVR
ncbi:pyridoxal 5'-phosphate synthase glutaminase subunit PdxT, partial [Dietzia sp.]|uniref:pyridoxal 5'-phosphate synthase glutaminase subunit PdxT n=1 Tax=Dietzia sp. TaxID=1871616 RepID=UPI002FD8BE70